MKRSSTSSSHEPNLEDDDVRVKRSRTNDEELKALKNQEYLQLILTRIEALQQQFQDDDEYDSDETSDLGDSEPEDSDEDIMDEVLDKIFKDFPSTASPSSLHPTADNSAEIQGFEVCRKVAVDFAKDLTYASNAESYSEPGSAEARKQMLRSFDLHLAAKERDYAARLTGE